MILKDQTSRKSNFAAKSTRKKTAANPPPPTQKKYTPNPLELKTVLTCQKKLGGKLGFIGSRYVEDHPSW